MTRVQVWHEPLTAGLAGLNVGVVLDVERVPEQGPAVAVVVFDVVAGVQ